MPTDDLLQAGMDAVQAGDLARANSLLARVVQTDPRSEEGWLWLGRSRTLPEQRAFCFNQVLAINPGNREARQELQGGFKAVAPTTSWVPPSPGVLWKPRPAPVPGPTPEAPEAADNPAGQSGSSRSTRPDELPESAPESAAPIPAGEPDTNGFQTRPDELSQSAPESAAPVPAGEPDTNGSSRSTRPDAPARPAQPSPKTALNPLWLVAGLAAIMLICLVGVSALWYVANQASAPPDVTAVPTLPPTPAPPTLTPTPQPTATNPFPPEWTEAPAVEGASLTPRPSATTSAKQQATAQALVTQASQKMKASDYEHAIGLLDKAIDAAPRYGGAYYLRASAGNLLTQYGEAAASEQPELYHYLGDINQALALDPPSGNYYLVRFHLEESLALVSPYRVDQDFWHTQALADIRQANALGNTEAYSDRQPPFVLANLGRCQEAQDQVNQLFKTKPQPSAGLYSALAASDLCQKDAQSALKHIDAAISSQATTDRLLSRVVILYSLGRYADARAQLDSTLKAHPDVCPCRYAWRALLDYKLGDSEMARGDLAAARKATPPTGGVDAYIQGLLALESGDKAGAVRFFQDAEAKLTRGDGPILLEEIRQQLAQAGAAALAPTVSAPPTPAPRP